MRNRTGNKKNKSEERKGAVEGRTHRRERREEENFAVNIESRRS